MSQEFESGSGGWLWLRAFHEVTVQMTAGAVVNQSPEGLTMAGISASKMAHSDGCRQKAHSSQCQ